jgi:hypothetical protein
MTKTTQTLPAETGGTDITRFNALRRDPDHHRRRPNLGALVGITSVLHTWGSALTHHPHVHMIVPGGGISLDGERWVACRPGFFLASRHLHLGGAADAG